MAKSLRRMNSWSNTGLRIDYFQDAQLGHVDDEEDDGKLAGSVVIHPCSLEASSGSLLIPQLTDYFETCYKQLFAVIASRMPSAQTVYLSIPWDNLWLARMRAASNIAGSSVATHHVVILCPDLAESSTEFEAVYADLAESTTWKRTITQ